MDTYNLITGSAVRDYLPKSDLSNGWIIIALFFFILWITTLYLLIKKNKDIRYNE